MKRIKRLTIFPLQSKDNFVKKCILLTNLCYFMGHAILCPALVKEAKKGTYKLKM